MLETEIGIVSPAADGSAAIALYEPITCRGCNQVVAFLISRAGTTRCVGCDATVQASAQTEVS
jgi:hypothetical protein